MTIVGIVTQKKNDLDDVLYVIILGMLRMLIWHFVMDVSNGFIIVV